uniref:Uncharacterized protein n=1 Tax=Physcomitrium patens TaxID=3218 RepID=A0A2K1IIC9_PHYPA|nr:hypothetical protein PHYPA_027722 [Physcomitrium patens]
MNPCCVVKCIGRMYFEQQLMFSAEYMHFIVYGRSGVPAREGVSEGMTDLG